MYFILRGTFTSTSLLLIAAQVVAAQYSFVNIADTRGPFDSFWSHRQAVSEAGAVAFIGFQGGVAGSYVGDGIVTNLIADLAPSDGLITYGTSGSFAINESGLAVAIEGQCCLSGRGVARVQLHEPTGTRTIHMIDTYFGNFGPIAINNSGHVAFGMNSGWRELSIGRWFNGASTTVVDGTDGFEGYWAVGLNEQGDVAFQEYIDDGATLAYYRTDGTTLTLIADSSGPLNMRIHFNGETAINDAGAVAFWSPLDSGEEGIFVGDGGPLSTVVIADPTTPFYDLGPELAINNQGTVAFFGRLWDGRSGIFTGPDPVSDLVVAHGDLLFGQVVTGLGRPNLNERGDLAFRYEVRDFNEPSGYRTGIALAVRESPLPGDYNGNGIVDAADYAVWHKGLGTVYTQSDYDIWRAHFGQTAGSGAAAGLCHSADAAVPEPAAALLTLTVLSVSMRLRRRRARGIASSKLPTEHHVTPKRPYQKMKVPRYVAI